jgi:solute carrier family 36 (proton-coupled amino acid transporter)
VPNLGLFISLVGALCATALAIVFPPAIELIVRFVYIDFYTIFLDFVAVYYRWKPSERIDFRLMIKNVGILTVALVGLATGTYQSISDIIKGFMGT